MCGNSPLNDNTYNRTLLLPTWDQLELFFVWDAAALEGRQLKRAIGHTVMIQERSIRPVAFSRAITCRERFGCGASALSSGASGRLGTPCADRQSRHR